jgi:hypothetical protein
LLLEEFPGQARLPDDRLERANPKFTVIWYGDRERRGFDTALHHDVAAPLADLHESVLRQDPAGVAPGQDAEPTQP